MSEFIQSHVTRGIVWGALQQAQFHHSLQKVCISTPSVGSLAPQNHLGPSQEDPWLLGGGGRQKVHRQQINKEGSQMTSVPDDVLEVPHES